LWVLFAIGCGSTPDDPSTTPDAPAQTTSCGDGVCEGSEVGACPSDCGSVGACGDGTCASNENATNCPSDCTAGAVCGDGTCTAPETAQTCPDDCGGTGGGTAQCGNLVCEAGEDALSCPTDCGGGTSTCPGDPVDCIFCWVDPTSCIPPQTEQICEECLGLGGGGSAGPCNIDLVCDPGEDPTNCPTDCP
jgi:hypothetical protein